MHPRRWLLPTVLGVLVAAVVLLPTTDPGRHWLLQRAAGVLQEYGYSLDYRQATGNPWLGVELRDARLIGPGADLTVNELAVDYFLPSLMTGELPLSLRLDGVRGSVDVEELQPPSGGDGEAPVSVQLREVSVEDVALEVGGSPWRLPALDIGDVSIARRQELLEFQATLRSQHGSAQLAGAMRLSPWSLELDIVSADARLARHWWEPVEAGQLQGRLQADEGGVSASLDLSAGRIDYLGAELTDISGPVEMDGGVISGNLSASGLGGPIQAEIEVNTAAERWSASASGQPRLAALANRLAVDAFEANSLALSGNAEVELTASGWSEVRLEGRAVGQGELLQLPLEVVDASFEYATETGTRAEASGELAGGRFDFQLAPEESGQQMRLTLADAEPLDGLAASVTVDASSGSEGIQGQAEGRFIGEVLGRELAVDLDALLNDDGLQAFVDGDGEAGALEGAVVISGGNLNGRLSLRGLTTTATSGTLELTLSASGPMEELPMQLEIAGPGSDSLTLGGFHLPHSFAGSVEGTLIAGELVGVAGGLGPLSLSGRVDLVPLEAEIDYRLATVRAYGPAEVRLAEANGQLSYRQGEYTASTRVGLERASVSELILGPLLLAGEASWDGTGSVSFSSVKAEQGEGEPALAGRFDLHGPGMRVSFSEPPLTLSGRPLAVSGAIGTSSPQGRLQAELRARSSGVELRVEPMESGHALTVAAQPGASLGPLTLRGPLLARGEIAGDLSRGQLEGTLDDLPLRAGLSSNDGRVEVDATLGESFRVAYDVLDRSWSAAGSLELSPLASAFGLPAEGHVQGELARDDDGYRGQLQADGELAGLPLALRLTGAGDRLLVAGEAEALATEWDVSGELSGKPTLTASSNLGHLELAGNDLSGSGDVQVPSGPLELGELAWTLQGDLKSSTASLEVGESSATLDWSAGPVLRAEIAQEFQLGSIPGNLAANLDWRAGEEGELDGSVLLAGQPLALTGNVGEVRLEGNLDAQTLTREFLGTAAASGQVSVDARATLPGLDSVEAELELSRDEGGEVLQARVAREAGEWRAEASGEGITLDYREGAMRVVAEDAPIDPLLAALPWPALSTRISEARADGELTRDPDEGWSGRLALTAEEPAAELELVGGGERLLGAASIVQGQLQARLDGRLLPDLDVSVTATAPPADARLEGNLTGTLVEPRFAGAFNTSPLVMGPLSLPAIELALSGSVAEGARLSVTGEGTSLTLTPAQLAGQLGLSLELAGREHRLSAVLGGTAARPSAEVRLEGPLLAGEGEWQGDDGSARLTLNPDPWLPRQIRAEEPVALNLTAQQDGWHATIHAPLVALQQSMEVSAEITGRGAGYQGVAAVDTAAGRLLEVDVSGEGTAWQAAADLAASDDEALAGLLPLDGELRPTGSIGYDSESQELALDVILVGTLAGRPVDLALTAESLERLQASGEAGGLQFELETTQAGLEFELAASQAALGGSARAGDGQGMSVSASVDWGEEWRLALGGVAAGEELVGEGEFDPQTRRGNLAVSLGESRLTAALSPAGDDLLIAGAFDSTAGGPPGLPMSGEWSVLATEDGLTLERLELEATLASRPAELRLAGPLWPETRLAGGLTTPVPPTGETVDAELSVEGELPGTVKVAAHANGLELQAQRDARGWQAGLSGQGLLAETAEVRSGLHWTLDQGFSGQAELQVPLVGSPFRAPDEASPGDYLLSADLTGSGGLDVRASLTSGEAELASGELQVAARPWEEPGLQGQIELAGNLEQIWPQYSGETLALSGRIELGGEVTAPTASGTIALAGALSASGVIDYQDGHGSLHLEGSGLRFAADMNPSGRLEASARLDLDLAELPLGQPLVGSLAGDVELVSRDVRSFADGMLRGDLRLEEAGVVGNGARLSGSVALSGPTSDPRLRLDLTAGGTAAGGLAIDAAPAAGSLAVSSDLSLGALVADVEIAANRASVAASGSIELPGGNFTLTAAPGPGSGADGRVLRLDGHGRYRDWRLQLQPGSLALSLEADLASLMSGVSGRLELRAGGERAGRPWLSGRLRGAAWQSIELGDVSFEGEEPGGEITVAGDAVAATIRPAAGLAWQVSRLALPLPGDLRLTATGSGRGSSGQAQLLVSGDFAGEGTELEFSAELAAGGEARVSGEGSLLAGSLSLTALLDDGGWRGEVELSEAELAGQELDLTGMLSGPLAGPELRLSAEAGAENLDLLADAVLTVERQSARITLESTLLDSPLGLLIEREVGDGVDLRLAGRVGEELTVSYPGDTGQAPAVSGGVELEAGPAVLSLEASSADQPQAGLALRLKAPQLPGFTLAGTLTPASLARPARLLDSGIALHGQDSLAGEAVLAFTPVSLSLADIAYRNEEVALHLSGEVGQDGKGSLTGRVVLLEPLQAAFLPALPADTELPFQIAADGESVRLRSGSELGELELDYEIASGRGRLALGLELAGGSARGEVTYTPDVGPSGELRLSGLPLALLTNGDTLRLSGELGIEPEALSGNAQLQGQSGSLRASGSWGLGALLPAQLAPRGDETRRLELQLGTFDLQSLPVVQERLPYLSAPISGFLQVQGRQVVGRLVSPDLVVSDSALPVAVDISGNVDEVRLSTQIAGSPIRLSVTRESVSAVATLERFPLHRLAEAITGPTDVSAEVTGVARLVLPWRSLDGLVIEIATELIRLEREEVVTTGNVSLVLADGEVTVNEAEFSGAGRWRAEGSIRPELLDFRLSAEEADFGPLLGLVPMLARYGVGAQGSLELRASGSLADPVVTLATPALEFEVAGSDYRLTSGEATLQNERLAVAATVSGLSPVTGQVAVAGGARLDLLPLELSNAVFTARGAADVPGLGEVRQFEATVSSRPEAPLWLEATGTLGQAFQVEGNLAPLDLRFSGDDLSLRLPQLLLAAGQADARLRARWEELLVLSGSVDVDSARFELGIRPPRPPSDRQPNPLASQVVFDSVLIRAPGRVRFNENFGSAETALDLALTGTAAAPALAGTAQVLRGTFQFSGRDFQITSAQAHFDPSRGLLPLLEVVAVTSFDMNRVQPDGAGVRFVAPREGSRFEVTLAFTGEVEAAPGENPPIRLDLSPSLTSEALIQEVREDGLTSGPRSLTEPELLSLITLGRLELNAPLAGQSALATAVAEGALDTAVDLLVVSELQTALAEALGVDMVEIRTTALSSILDRSSSDPFSVSLRLGGYLSDEVFASYRIGTFDDVQGLYALTNEVSLAYELGALELDLAGRVNFEDTRAPTPDAEVSATIRYAFDPLTSLEAGIDLSDDRQQVRFGVTLRW